jgi:RNA-directed DNA polymerase
VVQGALKLILEPLFEADFQEGSYGYRPGRSAHEAVERVADAIVRYKTRVLDIDLHAYFDHIRHDVLLAKVAKRINDPDVLHVLKLILKTTGKKGVAQGDVIAPLLSNLYLTEVDRMLERAKAVTRRGKYTYLEYARFADDIVILIDAYPQHDWLLGAVEKRLRQELALLQVPLNEVKSRIVDLAKGESFGFLGFDFRRVRTHSDKWRAHYAPQMKKRTALLRRLKDIFRRYISQPIDRVIDLINPILRGWVAYFAIGDSSRCFGYVQDWVEKKIRRHLMRARKRKGFGWKRWSRRWLYDARSADSASQLPCRVNPGGANPIEDRLNRVNEDLKTDSEKSQFFNRTASIHDRCRALVDVGASGLLYVFLLCIDVYIQSRLK